MEHDNEFLNEAIIAYGDSKGIYNLLLELKARREENRKDNNMEKIIEPLKELIRLRREVKCLKAHLNAYGSINDILCDKIEKLENSMPKPCKKIGEKDLITCTIKEWYEKMNEELLEAHEAAVTLCLHDREAEELTDIITVCTSRLEAIGWKENKRIETQQKVNRHNEERGRL